MDQVLSDLTGADALTADDLHVFVGVTDFDLHQLVNIVGIFRPGAPAEQQFKLRQVLIDVIKQSLLGMGSVTPHFLLLGLAVKPVKRLLNLQKTALQLSGSRLHQGPEQSRLVGKAGINGAGAGSRRFGDVPQGGQSKAFFQKFLTGAAEYIFIDPFDLLCHGIASQSKTVFYNDVLNIQPKSEFVKRGFPLDRGRKGCYIDNQIIGNQIIICREGCYGKTGYFHRPSDHGQCQRGVPGAWL